MNSTLDMLKEEKCRSYVCSVCRERFTGVPTYDVIQRCPRCGGIAVHAPKIPRDNWLTRILRRICRFRCGEILFSELEEEG